MYLGSHALAGFYELSDEEPPDIPDLLIEIPHLQASFEDREVLTDKDRQSIKSLGLRFRGRQVWPMFRSYAPGFVPWYLSAGEARFLTVALEQSIEVALRLKDDPSLLEAPKPELLMIRCLGDGGWIDGWEQPAPIQVHLPKTLRAEPAEALRQQLPKQPWKLEVDLYGLTGLREGVGGRPYCGYHFLVVESKTGFVAAGKLLVAEPSFDEMWVDVPKQLVEALTQMGGLPAEIRVRRKRPSCYLAPAAE